LDGAMGVGVLTAGGLLCGISGILFWAHLKIDPRTTLREPALVVAVGVLGSGLGLLSLEYLYRNAYGMQVGFSILLLSILITSVAAAVLGWRFSSQGGIMDQLVTLRETVEETDTRVEQERAASELARVELQKTLALRIAELETEINNREATEN